MSLWIAYPKTELKECEAKSSTQKLGNARITVALATLIHLPNACPCGTVFNYIITFYFSPGPLPHSVPRLDDAQGMVSYSVFFLNFIVQCVVVGLVYCTLLKPCTEYRMGSFIDISW